MLYLVALFDLTAALLVFQAGQPVAGFAASGAMLADVTTSGLLLGLTIACMLLGHWYLNTPSMQLDPLRQLLLAVVVVCVARALLCGGGLAAEIMQSGVVSFGWGGLVCFRWCSGLVGISILAWMTWQTLRIPNTQSATGILYVAVIFSFMGELSSELLGTNSPFPL